MNPKMVLQGGKRCQRCNPSASFLFKLNEGGSSIRDLPTPPLALPRQKSDGAADTLLQY
jgi:hypothetical protein